MLKKLQKWFNQDQGEGSLYKSKRQWRAGHILSFLLILSGWHFVDLYFTENDINMKILLSLFSLYCFSLAGRITDFNFSYKMYIEERKKEIDYELKELKEKLKLLNK